MGRMKSASDQIQTVLAIYLNAPTGLWVTIFDSDNRTPATNCVYFGNPLSFENHGYFHGRIEAHGINDLAALDSTGCEMRCLRHHVSRPTKCAANFRHVFNQFLICANDPYPALSIDMPISINDPGQQLETLLDARVFVARWNELVIQNAQ